MKLNQNGKKINLWKWLFLLLLAINIGFVSVIGSRLLEIREPYVSEIVENKEDAIKIGTFVTDREQVNDTISAFLSEYQSKELTYTIYATEDKVLFEGKYKLLGYNVPLYVYFTPSTLKSGAIQLKVTSFSVGSLPLPQKTVLKYIKSTYDLPEIIEVVPKESIININVQDLENKLGVYLKATNIDLVGDQIQFDIFKDNSVSVKD